MDIAAYCRVSTDKADQLNSLEVVRMLRANGTGVIFEKERSIGSLCG